MASSSADNRVEWLAKCLAGSSAGIFSTCICSPLDVAKTRLQLGGSAYEKYGSGPISALLVIYREEGLPGWYKGLAPSVCSVGVFWCVYFPSYDYAKARISQLSGRREDSAMVHMTGAACAGLLTDVLTNPLWVVRTRLVTQACRDAAEAGLAGGKSASEPLLYAGMVDAFRTIYRDEGFMTFFSGLRASVIGLSHIMIQFPLYERLKADSRGADGELRTGAVIAAAAVSKVVASVVTYPHEVVRTKMQFDKGGKLYSSLGDAVAKTLQADGIVGFWHGFSLNIVRTIPQTVITFSVYEWLSKALSKGLSGLLSAPRSSEQSRETRRAAG